MKGDERTPTAAFFRWVLVPGMTHWVMLYQFCYDGEWYEYPHECGSVMYTVKNAEDTALRQGHVLAAQRSFLRDVPLGARH